MNSCSQRFCYVYFGKLNDATETMNDLNGASINGRPI